MNITVKEGVRVNVKATRRIMKKRGFRFRTFKNNPLRFSVFLTKKGEEMYANHIEAMMNMVMAVDCINKVVSSEDDRVIIMRSER